MPSWLKFAGLWGLAALAALTLSWLAVSQVRDRVIQPVTIIPTTIAAVASDVTDSTVVQVEPVSDDRPAPDPSTTATADPSTAGDSITSTTRPRSASQSTSSTAASQTTSTTAPPVTTTTAAPPPQTTATTAPTANTSSHSTPGGSVTISASPGAVEFVSAIPQAGFTTELRDTGPERVRVRFVSATTIFEFEAKWEDGQLEVETSEHAP